jgi:DNA polymerase-3 subunit epsilon
MLRDFIAIDFETANQEPSSVCSVGVVMVRDGQIVDSFYSLIQPEPNYYNYWCQRVHGITQIETVEEHRAGAEPNDDLTMLCLRVS